MYCCYCGKELPDEAEFCAFCGKPRAVEAVPAGTEDEETTPAREGISPAPEDGKTPAPRKKTRKWLIVGLVVFALAAVVAAVCALLGHRHYVTKVVPYEKACEAYEEGRYAEAMAQFAPLGDYQDSQKYLAICQKEKKYEGYDAGVDGVSKENIEPSLEKQFYGTWYWTDLGDKELNITADSVDGMEYVVRSLRQIPSEDGFEEWNCVLYFPELDSSFVFYTAQEYVLTDENGEETFAGRILAISRDSGEQTGPWPDAGLQWVTASSLTSEEIAEIQRKQEEEAERVRQELERQRQEEEERRRQEEEARRKPAYSDQTIIDKAAQFFQNKIGSQYDNTMLHSMSVDHSAVTYDWSTKTYICSLEVTYYPEWLDVAALYGLGSSSRQYQGTFVYQDTGSDLVLIEYDCG